jgi:Cu-Zn family superoxide dismutase
VEATETVTATETVEATETVTATGTVTATPTMTATGTVTATPTETVAATPTRTAVATPTVMATSEATPSESVIAGTVFTPTGEMTATATLLNTEGDEVGTARLTAVEVGADALPAVLVQVEVEAFAAAESSLHALHIHEIGECEAPDFESAGDHFNPTDSSHGFLNPKGPHAGDLPMIRIEEDGSATYEWITALVSLTEGETNLLDEDGSALVIHAGLDDYLTDPSGHSGDPLACGVIEAEGEAVTPMPEGTPQSTPSADGTPTPQAEDDAEAAVMAGMSDAEGVNILTSTLTEYIVVNQEGDTLGQIDNVLVDMETGELYYVIIEYGGFLDIGEQTIAIPLSALQWGDDEDLLLTVGDEQFENFPEISSDWPLEADTDWAADVQSFWQQVGVEAETPGAVVRTVDLVGTEVAGFDESGATVSDFVLDLAQNSARYVLLDLGEESLLAVPWSAIMIQEGTLALDEQLDVELLQEAPGFNRDTPGLLTESDWDEELRTFWDDAGYEIEQAVEGDE